MMIDHMLYVDTFIIKSWRRLVAPTVRMCREGITVSWTQAEKLRWDELTDPEMRRVFIDPSTGQPWLEGDVYTREDLADTLTALAEAGDSGNEDLGFYTGPLGRDFVTDLRELGGIMTEEDLASYKV